jgi:hypothetical protein
MADIYTTSHEATLQQIPSNDHGSIAGGARDMFDNLSGHVQNGLKNAEQSVVSNFGTLAIDGPGGTADRSGTAGNGKPSFSPADHKAPAEPGPGPDTPPTIPADYSQRIPLSDSIMPPASPVSASDWGTGKAPSIDGLPPMERPMNDNQVTVHPHAPVIYDQDQFRELKGGFLDIPPLK